MRTMPPLAAKFAAEASIMVGLAQAGEQARAKLIGLSGSCSPLRHQEITRLYEVAYLRVFARWERFLEESFLRYLCGYNSIHGQCTLHAGKTFERDLRASRVVLSGGKSFILWHDPNRVVQRAAKHFSKSTHETVVNSALARLELLAAVRHHIAHDQDDARHEFDNATMSIAGRRYRGSKAGVFLRDTVPGQATQKRWLQVLSTELSDLAAQIA